ncbi:MAG TPA: MurR/RpiR family transcriptional regulator [Bacillota bacterium]|nr:MurR/RpiR family transcriptional regulator [Bacillota bacterium]HPE38802.1 MurR/RpiR family transcriptional regulator [Bacillota bacterium]
MSIHEGEKRENLHYSLVEQIENNMDHMSKGQKAIARFVLSDYEKAAYMTAAKLGESTGVSESTVVRFTMELGYDGYPHFQKVLQEELKVKLTSVQRLNASKRFEDDSQALHSILCADIDNLKHTNECVDEESFEKAVNTILHAKRIYLMGLRSSSPLSSFMHYYMTLLFDDVVHIHSSSANEVFEQILPIGPGDVMIGISFPRYSTRTISSMQYARSRGANVVVITDKGDTPMTEHSDVALFARSDMASFVDSLTAPLSLINALLVALGIHRREHIEQSFEALENLWTEYQVYDTGKDRVLPEREDTDV